MTVTNWDKKISPRELFYHRERLRNRIFDCVIKALAERVGRDTVTKAMIAKRLDKDPALVSRWFSGPSNWTIDTISDLMLALNAELRPEYCLYEDLPAPNYRHPLSDTAKSASDSHIEVVRPQGSLETTGSSSITRAVVSSAA